MTHRATVGTSGGLSWGAGWPPNGLAEDLRPDEARGITYTSAPLDQPMSIVGFPEVVLHVASTMPVATCVVRLSEVAPDGVSALVSTGVLNLTHRRSDVDPEPMPLDPSVPPEAVRIPLRATGYRFTPGHRIRLTVLTSYWPALWPSPMPGELLVHHGPGSPSRLVLPGPARRRADARGAVVRASGRGPPRRSVPTRPTSRNGGPTRIRPQGRSP